MLFASYYTDLRGKYLKNQDFPEKILPQPPKVDGVQWDEGLKKPKNFRLMGEIGATIQAKWNQAIKSEGGDRRHVERSETSGHIWSQILRKLRMTEMQEVRI